VCADFSAMGYGLYRLLAGAPLLVPVPPGAPLDAFELNLFAAKPDRAQALARAGLLVEDEGIWRPDDAACADALVFLKAQAFASSLAPLFRGSVTLDPSYREALAAYAHWRSAAAPPAERSAALALACRLLEALCARAPTFSRLSTFARAAWDAGLRGKSVGALRQLMAIATQRTIAVTEPLWPVCPRYETVDPGADIATWLMAATVEQFERASTHSSQFGPPSPYLPWLCSTRFASAEMDRRMALAALRDGGCPAIPQRLHAPAADNLNATIWRDGSPEAMVAKRPGRRD